ncbi:LysM peptidoglycan-binding domain-containing protein [Lentilactobacillus buchneri]|uniref:LysM peptidoglycan-binding domain-containing protein n=1 Tax=Lentilactobacillus buchneri TaxID=1581 RepID=UPI0011EBEF44|nr:LysM domain-containing protein [Lentilactobacillus buchneri]
MAQDSSSSSDATTSSVSSASSSSAPTSSSASYAASTYPSSSASSTLAKSDAPTNSAPASSSAVSPVDEVYSEDPTVRAQQVASHYGNLKLTNQQKNFWLNHPNQCTYYEDATYQVQEGESIADVANHFKRGSEQLRWYNGISKYRKIQPGQVIYSPNRYFMVPLGE